MRRHRLDRLTRLSQGAALVGFGTLAAACNDTPKSVNSPEPVGSDPPHVNATATPTETGIVPTTLNSMAPPPLVSATPSAAPSTSASSKLIINAPPPPPPHINSPPKPSRTNG